MGCKMKKVVFISEYLNPPYDEGIKKTAFQLYQLLNQHYDLRVICRAGPENIRNINIINSNRLFLSPKIRAVIKSFFPDLIVYFPFASSTFAGFLRNFILSRYHAPANNIMIALQPKLLKGWQRKLVQFICPQTVLTPSPKLKKELETISISTLLIPLLTDLIFFKPFGIWGQKKSIRAKYGIPLDSFVVTHVGHLNHGRNLTSLIPLQTGQTQVVIVGSSSTPKDAIGPLSLKTELENKGIIILDGFIQRIDEIYQLSDLYIFPVEDQNSSIGMPLSILEARACGIPVLATDYGSVKKFLGDDFGGIYYSNPENYVEAVKKIQENHVKDFIKTDVSKLNEQFYKIIQQVIQ